ncbi:MAG: choice-of-anchor A family protein [Polyangiaceae bacterium]|nr:choice-of-anchor A family protein [Polyangiaceae bacterium]
MRLPRSAILCATALSALLAARVGLAAQRWCQPGDPLAPNGSADPVEYVCGQPGFEDCCTSHWGVACVQKAAAYHEDHNPDVDYCGRYAWTQGPIEGTGQYYPRDFNIIALNGSLSHLRDTKGPVAASQTVNIGWFRMNHGEADDIALIANRAILSRGTVYGRVLYHDYYGGFEVTFPAGGPTKFTTWPFNFVATTAKLKAMSNTLNNTAIYASIAAVKEYSTLKFAGSDPELNVFRVTPAQFNNTFAYEINVPATSTVIINVTGAASAVMQNAGFNRPPCGPSRILWNFNNVSTLTISSVGVGELGFPGSILAPWAQATLRWQAVSGTVVAQSADAEVELYTAPFHFPEVSGCLTLDPTWSCSADTRNDDQGRAASPADEAGFLEIDGGDYWAEGYQRTSPRHRVWYSFHPAEKYPETKPLAVIFNGGPGGATSCYLAAFNTGPMTLDPTRTYPNEIVENLDSWTDFANLLYIDAPGAGFSYPLRDPANPEDEPDLGTDMDRDAGNFLRVVLRFLARHPTLQNNRVILVGESYGGARSVLMLKYVWDYESVGTFGSAYYDPQLSEELVKHFNAVGWGDTPNHAQLLTQFGHQVLIEGLIGGAPQAQDTRDWPLNENTCESPHCWRSPLPGYPACDRYKCDESPGWIDWRATQAVQRIVKLSNLQSLLGVNPRTIQWMHASERDLAYGREDGHYLPDRTYLDNPTPEMTDYFGALDDTDGHFDTYFVEQNWNVFDEYAVGSPEAARRASSEAAGVVGMGAFVDQSLLGVHTFITEAIRDAAVFPVQIVDALGYYRSALGDLYTYSAYWATMDLGFGRWGALQISWAAQPAQYIFMPAYYYSGHPVSMTEPYFLKPDVETWYRRSLE